MESDVVVLKDLAAELGMDRSHMRRFVLGLGIDPFFVRTQESRNQATLAVSVEEAEQVRAARREAGFLGGPEPTPFRKETAGEAEKMIGQNIRTAEGLEAFRRASMDYVRDFVREAAIPNKVIPPTPLKAEDMEPGSEKQDAEKLYAWRDRLGGTFLLPSIGIEGTNDDVAHYIDKEKLRYAVPIDTITTEIYERTFPQIIAAGYNMHTIIEQTIALETLRRKNHAFLSYCEMAVASTGQVIEVEGFLTEERLTEIKHPGGVIRKEISPAIALMSEIVFTDLICRTDPFDEKNVLPSMACVRAIQGNLFDTWEDGIKKSTMWLFSPADILGDNLYHGDYNVWAHWEGPVLHFQGWEIAGFGIQDIRGITKVVVKF